jgi:hypothetical protein
MVWHFRVDESVDVWIFGERHKKTGAIGAVARRELNREFTRGGLWHTTRAPISSASIIADSYRSRATWEGCQ